jgi:TolA-binding protein
MYNQVNKMAYVMAIVFLLTASLFVGCESKMDKAKDSIDEAQEAVAAMPNDTMIVSSQPSAEWIAFKASTEKSISNNNEKIMSLRAKIKQPGMTNMDKLRNNRIDALEENNTALRTKLMQYKDDDIRVNYILIKSDIQKKLDTLEKALNNFDKIAN